MPLWFEEDSHQGQTVAGSIGVAQSGIGRILFRAADVMNCLPGIVAKRTRENTLPPREERGGSDEGEGQEEKSPGQHPRMQEASPLTPASLRALGETFHLTHKLVMSREETDADSVTAWSRSDPEAPIEPADWVCISPVSGGRTCKSRNRHDRVRCKACRATRPIEEEEEQQRPVSPTGPDDQDRDAHLREDRRRSKTSTGSGEQHDRTHPASTATGQATASRQVGGGTYPLPS